jgi:hypothetical protein
MRGTPTADVSPDAAVSLYHLLDPEVLVNPYPLYHRLRTEDPVHWDLARIGCYPLSRCGHGSTQVLGRPHAHPGKAERNGFIHAEPSSAGDGAADVVLRSAPTHGCEASPHRFSRPGEWRSCARTSRKSRMACSTQRKAKVAWM